MLHCNEIKIVAGITNKNTFSVQGIVDLLIEVLKIQQRPLEKTKLQQ